MSEQALEKQQLRALADAESRLERAQLDRLGRQRPPQLASMWKEVGFVASISLAQLLLEYFVSGFAVVLPAVGRSLDIPAAQLTWPASSFSLAVCAFLLFFGRVVDMRGGYALYVAGLAWYVTWSVVGGLALNPTMLNVCRGLQGLGAAMYLPAGQQLLGSVYRPGPRKNLVFSIYGAMAPFGFFVGFLVAGICAQYANWRWYFWIGGILALITLVVALWCIPTQAHALERSGQEVKMDWVGSLTLSSGLVLMVFALTAASSAPRGWATDYVIVTLVLGAALLGLFALIEGGVAEQPLLPGSLLRVQSMVPLMGGLLLAYGNIGLFLLYATLFCINILHTTPMQLVAWYVPHGLVGTLLAVFGGLILHHVPARALMAVSGVSIIIESLLLALAPADAGYWAWIFVPMVLSTVAIDSIFNVANVFFSTSLPERQQGLAGALSNVVLHLGIALVLGVAQNIEVATAGQGMQQSYHNVFWLGLALGATALVVFLAFVRIGKAESDWTADEKQASEQAV